MSQSPAKLFYSEDARANITETTENMSESAKAMLESVEAMQSCIRKADGVWTDLLQLFPDHREINDHFASIFKSIVALDQLAANLTRAVGKKSQRELDADAKWAERCEKAAAKADKESDKSIERLDSIKRRCTRVEATQAEATQAE